MRKAIFILCITFAFVSAPEGFAVTPDEEIIFVDSRVQGPGIGTRENPFKDFTQALGALGDPNSNKREIQAVGTFDPLILDPTKHSGTKDRPVLITRWSGKGIPEFLSDGTPKSIIATNGADHIIFDGIVARGGRGEAASGMLINNSEDIIVRNSELSDNEADGITVMASKDVDVEKNPVIGNNGNGVLITSSENIILRNNTINNNARDPHTFGVMVTESTGTQLSKNMITKNSNDGIWLSGSDGLLLEANDVADNLGDGFFFSDPQYVLLTWNRFFGNSGDAVEGEIHSARYSSVQIKNNVIANNAERGIAMTARIPVTLDAFNNTLISNGKEAFNFSDTGSTAHLYNNLITKHSVGMILETPNSNTIASDYNHIFDTAEEVVVHQGRQTLYWKEWRAAGHDTHTKRSDPFLSSEQTCVGATCANYHLSKKSPLIDAGFGGLLLPPFDIDGQARMIGNVDIGADEYSLGQVMMDKR